MNLHEKMLKSSNILINDVLRINISASLYYPLVSGYVSRIFIDVYLLIIYLL